MVFVYESQWGPSVLSFKKGIKVVNIKSFIKYVGTSVISNLIGSCEPHDVMTQEPIRFDVSAASQYLIWALEQYLS